MEVVEKDLSIEQSKSVAVYTEEDSDVVDLTLQLIVEEFKYLEILI